MESIDMKIKLPKQKTLTIDNMRFDSFYDFRLTEQDQEIANQELNERKDTKHVCLQQLKKRLESVKGLRCRTDDDYLLRYLRWTKYDCDKAYTKITKLYSLRNNYPELFLLPSNLNTLMNNFMCTHVPYRDEKGRVVFWIDFRKWNLDEMPFNFLITAFTAYADIISMNPHAQVNGMVSIWDFRGVSVHHVSLIRHPMKLWLLSNMLQDCYPWRVQQIVGIHCNPLIMVAYSAIRMFLKKKIADRIKLLGSDISELHQYFNPAVIPKEYGGTLDESECITAAFIIDNLPYLKYERSFGFQSSG